MTVETTLSAGARNVNWLLGTFVENTPGVSRAIAVSSDGLLMASSATLDRDSADKLAAVISGLRSLSDGAARIVELGGVNQVIIEMQEGFLFCSAISGGSSLGVVTDRDCDLGLVGYEVTLLVERVGGQLTPDLIAELKRSLSL
jgi:predicted regulator of Ras-like GTPase activity (Roadblock/LC7/MglB family)